jgi:hypothetical protein
MAGDSNPRVKPISADELRDLTATLRKLASRLSGVAEQMDEKKKRIIEVEGHAALGTGIEAIKRFAGRCEAQV